MTNLFLVATPIGNLGDFSYRAVDVLNEVDLIYCEDTRKTIVLLNHYNINTTLKSYHIHNEKERINEVLKNLEKGLNIALVSDAGYPSISDPGYLIVQKAIENNFNIQVVPGASACLSALVGSGLETDKFLFFGFLAHTKSKKEKELKSLINFPYTIIFYDSPLRIKDTLSIMNTLYPERRICIARELTKKFEEYIRGSVSFLQNLKELKGEVVIVLERAVKPDYVIELNELELENHFNYYLNQGYNNMEAMKKVSADRGISKSEIYNKLKKD